MSKRLIVILLLLIYIKVDTSYAQMQNSSYIIDTESKAKPEHQTNSKFYQDKDRRIIQGNGFRAVLAESNNDLAKPFIFSISDSTISFGNIKPGEAILRNQAISVTPNSANGYQVLASELHPLKADTNDEIPNTSCDNGNCTNIFSDFWKLPLTYGFGYKCENIVGSVCIAGINEATYKRFSNLEVNENPSLLLYSSKNETSKALIEYKVNVSGNQPNQAYTTTVNLLAVPNL